jgi:Flp pilus assembly pilin Flp
MQKLESQIMSGEIYGGQTTVEYAIVVAIVLGVAALLIAFRNQIGNMISNATTKLNELFSGLSNNMSTTK